MADSSASNRFDNALDELPTDGHTVIEATGRRRLHRRRTLSVIMGFALLATLASTRPASAASNNLCQSGEFSRIYGTNFGGSEALKGWSIYNGTPGHAGNGLRSKSAVKTHHGKLVITAAHQNGQTVSGGLSKRDLSQTYGCYRFRVRTDHDYSNVTSGVVMTWPTHASKANGGENDIYETTHRYAKRKPFMTFIHKPGDQTSNSREQHWYRHEAQADRYQIMTMKWTPNEMIIERQGLDIKGRYTTTRHTVPTANIPHVPHHPAIQLDARTKDRLASPVRLELDWFEVYSYNG